MKFSTKFLPACAALIMAAAFVAGCNSDRTKIGDIQSNPDHYAGRDVHIGGEVTKVWELPLGLSNLAVYRVNDGTGQIWVVSHTGAPVEGDKVGVKGTAQPIAREDLPFIHNVFGDVVEEHDRKVL